MIVSLPHKELDRLGSIAERTHKTLLPEGDAVRVFRDAAVYVPGPERLAAILGQSGLTVEFVEATNG